MSERMMIEQEIAALSVAIENKRAELLREHGVVPEGREVLHQVIGEQILGTRYQVLAQKPSTQQLTASTSSSYLDDLDPDTTARVNDLLDMVPKHGLAKSIEAAKNEPAHILDAFHDALVDKLHQELVDAKLI